MSEQSTTPAGGEVPTALVQTPPAPTPPALVQESEEGAIAAFASRSNFIAAQRMAQALAASTIVPAQYRGEAGLPNCLVAMELASRTGASVLMVMQNLYVIEGKPSWSSAFLIGAINTCGRFSPLRYEFEGEEAKDGWKCRAYATDLRSGDVLCGEWITWQMVKGEGWLGKRGSKWATMPGQMIRYRAAAFWSRTYAPEISLGMHAVEELTDVADARAERTARTAGAADLNAALSGAKGA